MTHPPSGSVPTRRRRDPKGTRDRLVRAALELFTSQGYHASTTPQIAARAGIAEGTIYRHFESKAHLLNEIYRAGLRLLEKPIHDAPVSLHCRERLLTIAAEWRVVAIHNPPLVGFLFGADFGQLLDHKSRESYRRFHADLESVIAEGKSAGEVKAGSVELWTDVWLRLVILVLERTASQEWSIQHPAPEQVLESAWGAIGMPSS